MQTQAAPPPPTGNSGTSRSVLRDAVLYGMARGLPGVLNLVTIALLTRILAPEQYGAYALVMAGVALGIGSVLGWLREGLARFLPSLPDAGVMVPIVRRTFVWIVGGTVLIGAALSVLGIVPGTIALLWLGLAFFWVQGWYEVQRDVARISLHPGRYGWFSLVRAVHFLGLSVLAAKGGWGAEGIVAAAALASLGALILVPPTRIGGTRTERVDRDTLSHVASYGAPLTATYLLWYVVAVSDRFLLGLFVGSEAIGLYAASYDLIDKGLGLLMLIQYLAAFPVLVRTFTRYGAERTRLQMTAYAGVLLAVAVPAAVGSAVLAPDLARILVGPAYREAAAAIIPWIAVSALVSGIKLYYVDIGFQLARRTYRQMAGVALAAVANVAVNLWAIPRYGVQGAAVTSLVSSVFALAVSWWLCRPVFRLNLPVGLLVRPLVAAAGMAIAVSAYAGDGGTAHTVSRIALGAVLYFVLLLGLESLGPGTRLRRLLGLLDYSTARFRR